MKFYLKTGLEWFRSYLSNRKQFTPYNDFKTEMKIVNCGVLRGSLLESLLLFIFVNELKLSSLQLNGNIFERENSLKFLGIILDDH